MYFHAAYVLNTEEPHAVIFRSSVHFSISCFDHSNSQTTIPATCRLILMKIWDCPELVNYNKPQRSKSIFKIFHSMFLLWTYVLNSLFDLVSWIQSHNLLFWRVDTWKKLLNKNRFHAPVSHLEIKRVYVCRSMLKDKFSCSSSWTRITMNVYRN